MHIDFLSFTFRLNKPDLQPGDIDFGDYTPSIHQAIETVLTQCIDVDFAIIRQKKGFLNYSSSFKISVKVSDTQILDIGMCAYGGNNETAYISITGVGCTYFDFKMLYDLYNLFERFKITRIDICEDFVNNSSFSFDYFVQAYKDEKFRIIHNPKHLLMGDFLDPDSPEGRTLYIGSRKSSKFVRIYEKGKQMNSEDRSWVRFEIEFKSVDDVIPVSSLINPVDLFVNAYPICKEFPKLSTSKVLKLQRVKKNLDNGVILQIENVKKQYGQFLNFIVNHTDIDINKLTRPGIPEKFKECLLIDFDSCSDFDYSKFNVSGLSVIDPDYDVKVLDRTYKLC